MTIVHDQEAEVVHHVFRPDDTPQTLRIGRLLPLHATALGKLLAGVFAAALNAFAQPAAGSLHAPNVDQSRSAGRRDRADPTGGVATGDGEFDPGRGRRRGCGARWQPLRRGGTRVARSAGRHCWPATGTPRPEPLAALRLAAVAVMHATRSPAR